MKIATTIAEVRAQVREWKQQGLTVGLVVHGVGVLANVGTRDRGTAHAVGKAEGAARAVGFEDRGAGIEGGGRHVVEGEGDDRFP